MRLKLLESIDDNFDTTTVLEFDVSDLLEDTDDRGKASGYISLDIDVGDDLWDFVSEDSSISDAELEILSNDDAAWEAFLRKNFDELVTKYLDQLLDKYSDKALDYLYDNWSSYSDEDMYSQSDEDNKSYYDLVASGLGLR